MSTTMSTTTRRTTTRRTTITLHVDRDVFALWGANGVEVAPSLAAIAETMRAAAQAEMPAGVRVRVRTHDTIGHLQPDTVQSLDEDGAETWHRDDDKLCEAAREFADCAVAALSEQEG